MKKYNILCVLTTMVICALLIPTAAFGGAGQPLARINAVIENDKRVEKSTDGSLYRSADGQWDLLEQGSEVFSGDEIKTGSSQLLLRYADGSGETLLKDKTHVKLSIPAETKEKTAFLKVGEIFNRIKGNFEVKGSGLNGAVEGTAFYTSVKEGTTTFVVLEGRVRVKDLHAAILLNEREMTEGGPALKLLAPKKAPEETVQYIVNWITRMTVISVTRISTQPYFKTAEERNQAFRRYSLRAALDSDDAVARRELGNVYLDWQDFPKAMAHYKKAISLNGKDALAHHNLGLVYSQQADDDRAAAHFLKAIDLDPKSAKSYNNLALVYDRKGDREAAILNFKKAVEIDEGFAAAYNNLGTVYFKTQRYDQAEEVFNKAVSLDPLFASAHNNLGNIHLQRGDYDKLIIEVWTDGSILPEDAVADAAKIIKDYLVHFINFNEEYEDEENEDNEELERLQTVLETPVEELELSVRSSNCLRNITVKTIGDLAELSEDQISKTKNFGI